MKIIPVTEDTRDEAILLLQKASLPVADIGDEVQLFVMQEDNEIIGTIGFEADGESVLLRSLSIDEMHRDKKIGSVMVDYLETFSGEMETKQSTC